MDTSVVETRSVIQMRGTRAEGPGVQCESPLSDFLQARILLHSVRGTDENAAGSFADNQRTNAPVARLPYYLMLPLT